MQHHLNATSLNATSLNATSLNATATRLASQRKRATGFAAAILATLSVSSCERTRTVEAQQTGTDVPTVAVAKASTEDLSDVLVLTAEFTPFQEIDVMAKVAGFVKQINVDIGDRVRQGQLLAVLEVPEMTDEVTRAKASVQRSEAQ